MTTYKRMVLASRLINKLSTNNFRIETVSLPEIGVGEVMIKNHYLSLDPFQLQRMYAYDEKTAYFEDQQAVDETMIGCTVGVVIESKSTIYKEGDVITGLLGCAEYSVLHESNQSVLKIDQPCDPLSIHLGILGLPGISAWYGFSKILDPKSDDVVLVTSAAGAVGSTVVQLAKSRGCKVIGITSTTEKCDFVVNELGADACLNYNSSSFSSVLQDIAGKGVDRIFDNAGGISLDTALLNMNTHCKIAMCGASASYLTQTMPIQNLTRILARRASIQAYLTVEHIADWAEGFVELGKLYSAGKLKAYENVSEGIDTAPQAFVDLFHSKNKGKQIVKM